MTTPRRRRKSAEVALNKAVKRGSTFIRDDLPVDGRLAIPRRYSELLNEILDDLGSQPTAAQLAIAKRASTLAVWAELREAALVRAKLAHSAPPAPRDDDLGATSPTSPKGRHRPALAIEENQFTPDVS